jgi:hypothetical protein
MTKEVFVRGSTWRHTCTLLLFLTLPLIVSGVACGEGFYTRTDELSCGNTKVRAFTTCAGNSDPRGSCTEQHFVFSDETTGAFVKVPASGETAAGANFEGRMGVWLYGVAWQWACLKGKTGAYVVMTYANGGNCDTCEWVEIFDLKGRRLATDGGPKTNANIARFNKTWGSLGLPRLWPEKAFANIKLRKNDR